MELVQEISIASEIVTDFFFGCWRVALFSLFTFISSRKSVRVHISHGLQYILTLQVYKHFLDLNKQKLYYLCDLNKVFQKSIEYWFCSESVWQEIEILKRLDVWTSLSSLSRTKSHLTYTAIPFAQKYLFKKAYRTKKCRKFLMLIFCTRILNSFLFSQLYWNFIVHRWHRKDNRCNIPISFQKSPW